jgi:hypothetical protein
MSYEPKYFSIFAFARRPGAHKGRPCIGFLCWLGFIKTLSNDFFILANRLLSSTSLFNIPSLGRAWAGQPFGLGGKFHRAWAGFPLSD